MSAAGRGAERVEFDTYTTPAWCVRRLLEVAPWSDATPECPGGSWGARSTVRILEPCAGEGAIVRVLRERYPNAHICATDTRRAAVDALRGLGIEAYQHDARRPLTIERSDLEITNPPFSLWHPIAHAALTLRRPTWLALLLRVGAIAHLDGLPTPSLYVLPNRPAFVQALKCKGGANGRSVQERPTCGWRIALPIDAVPLAECPCCGGKVQRSTSDASEYAWFVWGPQEPRVVVLADTPLSERKAA